jgi:hypothetical protein
MISSQGDDQNAQGSQSSDILTTLGRSLSLHDRSSGQTRLTNGCEPRNDKEFSQLKIRVQLHEGKELHSVAGAAAAESPIDAAPCEAVHEIDPRSDYRRAVGKRLVRTVVFGVLTGLMVGAAFAWHFYGDVHSAHKVDTGDMASKTSDRVSTQDQAALPTLDQAAAAPVHPPAQVSVATGSSPEMQDQLGTIASDVAVVRRIVERLSEVQEQVALDIATLQKSNQNASQKTSLLPHSLAAPVPSRKYAPNIARSDVVAHSPSVPIPSAPARTPSALR